jgi:MarR family transcriptional regulator, 2-MHQ and catechol-resistance regulon repressor
LFKQINVSTFAAMKIEEAIRQTKPMQPLQKAMINLMYTYHWQMERSAELFKPFDLTAQQFNVLRILRGRHPEAVSVGEVKAVLLDKNPDMTRLCDRLVQKSLIQREFNCKNRREVLISITTEGLTLLDTIDPIMQEAAKTWDTLSAQEYETLSNLLDKLRG